MEYIKFEHEKKYIQDFIKLPKIIYSKEKNMENEREIKNLLLEMHPLSKYFHLDKFLIYDNKNVVGRFCITTYPDDNNAYIGFFECVENEEIANFLFKVAYDFAKKNGYINIVGPVDASFWIKYRLKINLFEGLPYTGEPYNREYYYRLFLDNGYEVAEHYTSNIYSIIRDGYTNEKYEERYSKFMKNGYEIINPEISDYEKVMEELYYLITDLYNDFPIYKSLSLEDFKTVFSSYKSILNTDMVKMAYYDKKPVGFFVSIPNYNNKVHHLNFKNMISILKTKKKPREYVMLYMGVDKEHKGLGSAFVKVILEELKKNKLPSIGALVRDGKITQTYAKEFMENKYEYVLLKRRINL